MKCWLVVALFLMPVLLPAYSSGGPYAHTGGYGEPTCESFGCHTPNPLPGNGGGRVVIDVGPYVPGQRQQIVVTVIDSAARRWGFQLAARLMSNPATQAGSLAVPVMPADYTFTQVRCADGSALPCSTGLQYAGHTSVGTRANNPSGYVTFLVDWIAPSSDVGPVVFTAAGLGADGDQGTN
ncbi:MAG TPA: choice-of-anchor V domain-containing protein, partial [Bryobacterales bacterium]|nr:choice-of-anchor V domain-containing protein [Bryobacterales bacterium]